MNVDWFYQLQGFALGPVPAAEMKRLIQKGRIAPDTFVRQGNGPWVHAGKVEALNPSAVGGAPADPAAPGPEPWHLRWLGRWGAWAVPVAVALMLPGHRATTAAGWLVFGPVLAASVRLAVGVARDLRAIRHGMTKDTAAKA
jgi:hypothetical protein